jgi:hypothetical protein
LNQVLYIQEHKTLEAKHKDMSSKAASLEEQLAAATEASESMSGSPECMLHSKQTMQDCRLMLTKPWTLQQPSRGSWRSTRLLLVICMI